jgi:hypothetical protein
MEDDTRSELSYVEPPIAGASPATIPTSAVSESSDDDENDEVILFFSPF